jgi:uncharacterized protein (DUF433 family)
MAQQTSGSVIHSDPEILGGTPVFVGTRVPLKNLIDYLEGGHSLDEFLVLRHRGSEGLSFRAKRGICSCRFDRRRTADPSQARDDRNHPHRCDRVLDDFPSVSREQVVTVLEEALDALSQRARAA